MILEKDEVVMYQYAAKAINGFCVTAAGGLATAVAKDGVSPVEVVIVALTAIAAGAAVFYTENHGKK